MKRPHLGLLLAIAGLVAAPQMAAACSCMALDPNTVVGNGDLIAEGTVMSVRTDPATSLSETLVELTRVWKGPQVSSLRLEYTEGDGANCGPMLKPDQQIALLAYREEDGHWTTSMCSLASKGAFSDPADEFGKVAQPILENYRAEGGRIAALVQADPLGRETGLQLASHQLAGGDFDAALATYRRTLARHPKVPAAYAGIAGILEQQGQMTEALAAIRDGLRAVPGDPALREIEQRLLAAAATAP